MDSARWGSSESGGLLRRPRYTMLSRDVVRPGWFLNLDVGMICLAFI